jgi:hypothetical protein
MPEIRPPCIAPMTLKIYTKAHATTLGDVGELLHVLICDPKAVKKDGNPVKLIEKRPHF